MSKGPSSYRGQQFVCEINGHRIYSNKAIDACTKDSVTFEDRSTVQVWQNTTVNNADPTTPIYILKDGQPV